MLNSSAKCRQQEAHHRRIAEETDLPNVRRVALAASRAWERQALKAEESEAGARDVLSDEDAAIALEFLLEDEINSGSNEDKARHPSVSLSIQDKDKTA